MTVIMLASNASVRQLNPGEYNFPFHFRKQNENWVCELKTWKTDFFK